MGGVHRHRALLVGRGFGGRTRAGAVLYRLPGFRRSQLNVEGQRVLVLGVGVAGEAAAEALAKRGARVLASEQGELPAPTVQRLEGAGIDVETGSHAQACAALNEFDLIVPSPGISPRSGLLADAIAAGRSVATELEVGFGFHGATIAAITGTNGKTTVVHMVEAMAKASGLRAVACGNTELPFLRAIDEHPDAELWVIEASSFRLAFCQKFQPRVAAITNIAPDHLDWHGSMDNYRMCKANITAAQRPGDVFIHPADDPSIAGLAPDGPRLIPFGIGGEGVGAWVDGDAVHVDVGEGPVTIEGLDGLPGQPFAADAAVAALICRVLQIGQKPISQALSTFSVSPHRMQRVGQRDGVVFIDDSKATNPHAVMAAVAAFPSVVLIAGGRSRSGHLESLASISAHLRHAVVMGEARDELATIFLGSGVAVTKVGTMSEAVGVATEHADAGDTVLLSPGCASFDAFSSYAERGELFTRACLDLGVRA